MELIKQKPIINFSQHEETIHHAIGIEGYVDLTKLALELQTVVKNLASGPVPPHFHAPERDLYAPITRIFENHLPSTGLVFKENVIYKTGNNLEKTDLSICQIHQNNFDRLDIDIDLSHFFEIKSVFFNDFLEKKDLDHDIEKLIRCETAYDANCFFILIGLEKELNRRTAAVGLINSYDSGKVFNYTTSSNVVAHLRQAGKTISTDPHVYVFEVSHSTSKYNKKGRLSGLRYSVFQLK